MMTAEQARARVDQVKATLYSTDMAIRKAVENGRYTTDRIVFTGGRDTFSKVKRELESLGYIVYKSGDCGFTVSWQKKGVYADEY